MLGTCVGMKVCEKMRRIVFVVVSIIVVGFIWGDNAAANVPAPDAGQISARGYSGNRIFFETSGQLPIKEFEWVSFSCGNYEREVQARNFRMDGNSLTVELYEMVPCEGRAVGVNYRTTSNSYQRLWLSSQAVQSPQIQLGVDSYQPARQQYEWKPEQNQSRQSDTPSQRNQYQWQQKSAQSVAKKESTNPGLAILDFLGGIVAFIVVLVFCVFVFGAMIPMFLFLGGLLLIAYGGQLAWDGHAAGWLMIIPGIFLALGLGAGFVGGGGSFIKGWFTPK